MIKQDVGLHYKDNVIKVEAPTIEGRTPASLMHHTTKVKFNIEFLLYNLELYSFVWHDFRRKYVHLNIFQGITQYRQAGYCFMLGNGFHMFSTNMDDWYQVCIKYLYFQKPVLTIKSYGKIIGKNYLIIWNSPVK